MSAKQTKNRPRVNRKSGVRFLNTVPRSQAKGLLDDLYTQIETEYLLAPPFTLHSPVPELLASMWCCFRESFLVGRVPHLAKEAVAMGVSLSNRCPYCVEAHTMALRVGAGNAQTRAITRDLPPDEGSSPLAALARWAETMRNPRAEDLAHPPFGPEEAPEIIGTGLIFHYINRLVSVFCDDSPFPLPSALGPLHGLLRRVMAWMMAPRVRTMLNQTLQPDPSLTAEPEAPRSKTFNWAAGNPNIRVAFEGFAAVLNDLIQSHIPPEVQQAARRYIHTWDGEDPGLSTAWLEDSVADLSEADRSAARLALLVSVAPYRVDAQAIGAFQKHFPGNTPLLILSSWASFSVLQAIGTRLQTLYSFQTAYPPIDI